MRYLPVQGRDSSVSWGACSKQRRCLSSQACMMKLCSKEVSVFVLSKSLMFIFFIRAFVCVKMAMGPDIILGCLCSCSPP